MEKQLRCNVKQKKQKTELNVIATALKKKKKKVRIMMRTGEKKTGNIDT